MSVNECRPPSGGMVVLCIGKASVAYACIYVAWGRGCAETVSMPFLDVFVCVCVCALLMK